MKKISCAVMAVVLLIMTMCFTVEAAENTIRISYAKANLPEIVINAATGSADITAEDVTINFDGTVLNAVSASAFSQDVHTRRVFFVVDLSTSMTNQYFSQAKSCINSFVENMGNNTSVYIISFGKEVDCVVNGSSDRTEIAQAVDGLSNNQGGTKFFAAIKEAIDISKNCEIVDMEYMVVFSDGEDFQTGDTTQKEVEAALSHSAMPIYAMRANTGRVSAKDIAAFRELVSASNGEMYSYSANNAALQFAKLDTSVKSQVVIHATAQSNVFSGASQPLYIKVKDMQSEAVNLSAKSRTDSIAPQIITVPTVSKEENSITFELSEDVINASGGVVTKEDIAIRTSGGKDVEVSDLIYTNMGGNYRITVFLAKPIVKQEYQFVSKGITDNSIEKNLLAESYTFTSDTGISKLSAFVVNYWYLFVVLFVLLILILIMLVMMKRKNVKSIKLLFVDENTTEIAVQHYINTEKGRKIRLLVDSGSGTLKTIDFEIRGSAIFGRADMCNIVFDDTKMSRQHFCIGEEDGRLVLSDLETTNGTYLNGVVVHTPQVLKNGDRIFAGLSTITIEFAD